ncbi:MAG: hypothetical protein LQ350_008681, partial [Teloschistes chrysophthalmus]
THETSPPFVAAAVKGRSVLASMSHDPPYKFDETKPFHTQASRQALIDEFADWPHTSPTPAQIVDAGVRKYIHETVPADAVACDWCKSGVCSWAPSLDPLHEHLRYAPSCERALLMQQIRKENQDKAKEKEAQIALEKRIQFERDFPFKYRRCPERFSSNTQLHRHISAYHAKKSSETSPQTPSTTPESPTSSRATSPAPPTPSPLSTSPAPPTPAPLFASPSSLPDSESIDKFAFSDDRPLPEEAPDVSDVPNTPEDFCRWLDEDHGAVWMPANITPGGNLQFTDPSDYGEPLEPTQSVSLTSVLMHYRLTGKMKLILAYILAQSVWRYYNSDWMKTQWSTDSIHFLKIQAPDTAGTSLYAYSPCFAVQFLDPQIEVAEFYNGPVAHKYPRLLALGNLLLDIGRQRPLLSSQPTMMSNWESPSATQDAEGRRGILYKQIVAPLAELLDGLGWTDALGKIEPMEEHALRGLPARTAEKRDTEDVLAHSKFLESSLSME